MTKRGAGNNGRRTGPAKPAPTRPAAERTVPHNLEAEEALLGAAMCNGSPGHAALEVLVTKVRPDDFYRPIHGHIAAALGDAFERDEPADPIAVADRLRGQGLLDAVGGLGALLSLQANTPAISNAGRYADIVHKYATLRRLIGSASEIAELAYQVPDDVHGAVETAQRLVADVAANNGARTYSTLEAHDLAPYLAGTVRLEEPELLARSDGARLIYAGKMNGFAGPPSVGKGWIVLACCVEILTIGGTAVYLDYEDSPRSIADRLASLGVTGDQIGRFTYLRPSGPFGLAERAELAAILARTNADLVVIDGVAEAMARDRYDEKDNTEIAHWIDAYPRWIARQGPAVVLIDHVPKDPDHPRGPRGGGHKLAAVDGAAYEVSPLTPFSRHKAGSLKLKVDKDRLGTYAVGDVAAIARIEPQAAGEIVRVRLDPPPLDEADIDRWKPSRCMEDISKELERAEAPMPTATIKAIVSHKARTVGDAIKILFKQGYIGLAPGRGIRYISIKPYRADDDHRQAVPDVPINADNYTLDQQLFAEDQAEEDKQ